jgi:hypothetical protein
MKKGKPYPTIEAMSAYFSAMGKQGARASAESRRRLKARVLSGEATPEERARYEEYCAEMRRRAGNGGRSRASRRITT